MSAPAPALPRAPSARAGLPAVLLLLAWCAPAGAQSVLVVEDPAERIAAGHTFTLVDGFAGSDAVPPYYLTEDPWPVAAQPRAGRNLAVVNARSALGARVGPATIDYFYRRDWWFEGSAGAVRFYELDRRRGLVAAGETLDIDYRWQGFDADGLRLSFADRLDLFRERDTVFGVSLAGLRLQQVRREWARGRLASDGASARLQSEREIWYSGFAPGGDSLTGFRPDQELPVPTYGYGYSVDLGLRYEFGRYGRTSALRIAATDVLSHLKWGGVPHLTQRADIVGADADFTAAAPGVVERSAYDTLRFAPPPKVLVAIDYAPGPRWRLHGEQIWYRDESFALAGVGYRVSDALQLRTDYDLRWKTVGIKLAYRRFTLGLRTDRVSPRRAHAAGGTLRLELDF